MNKRNAHLVKSPEKELQEKETQIKYLDKKLTDTWNQLIEAGCEIDNPLSINFQIINKKARKLECRINKIKEYIRWQTEIPEGVRQKLSQLTDLEE